LRTDANGVGFRTNAHVTNINIVTAGGKIRPCGITQRDVAAPGCNTIERCSTVGRVAIACGIFEKRPLTRRRVEVARSVAKERGSTIGRVPVSVVLRKSARTPAAVLSFPRVFPESALSPLAVFSLPVVSYTRLDDRSPCCRRRSCCL
jgi:hypothetical protein